MIELIIIIVFIILILYRIRNTEKYETNKEPFFTLWVPAKKEYEKQQPAHIKNGKVVPPKTVKYKYDYNTIYIEIVDYDKGLIKEIEYKSPKPYLVTTTHNEYILPVNYSDEFKDYMNKKVVIKFYRNGKNPDNFFHVTHVTLPKSKDSESSNISNLESDDYKSKKSVQDCIGSWNVIKKNIKKRGNLTIRTDDWEYKHTKNAGEGGKACPYENGKRIAVKYSDIVSRKAPFRDPNINTKLITSPNYIFDEIDRPERVAYLLSKGAYVHPMDRPSSQPPPPPPSLSPPPPPSSTKNCKVEFCTAYVDKDKENNGFEVNECKELYSKHKNEVTMYNQLYKNKDPRISDPSKQNAIWEDSKYKYTKFKYTVISLDTNAKNGCNGYIKLKKNSHPDYVEMNKFIEKNLKVGDTKTFIVKLINEKYIDKMVEDKKIDKIQGKLLKDKYTKMSDKKGYAYLNTYMPFMIKLFINPSYIANEFDKWENDNKSYFGKCDNNNNNGDIIWKKINNRPVTKNINPVYKSRSKGEFSCPESVKYCSPDKNEWKYNVQAWKEGIKNDINELASGSKGCYVNPKAESLLKPRSIQVYYPYKKHDNMENMDLDPNTNTNLLQDPKYYWKKHMDIVTPKKSDKDCKAELQKPNGNRWTWGVPSGSGQINNMNMNWVDEIEWKYVVTNPGKDGGDKDHCFYNIPNSAHGLKDGDKIKIKTTNLAKYYKDVPKGLEWGKIGDGTSSRYIRDPNYFHELIKNPNYWVDKFNVVGRMKMGKPVYTEYF